MPTPSSTLSRVAEAWLPSIKSLIARRSGNNSSIPKSIWVCSLIKRSGHLINVLKKPYARSETWELSHSVRPSDRRLASLLRTCIRPVVMPRPSLKCGSDGRKIVTLSGSNLIRICDVSIYGFFQCKELLNGWQWSIGATQVPDLETAHIPRI